MQGGSTIKVFRYALFHLRPLRNTQIAVSPPVTRHTVDLHVNLSVPSVPNAGVSLKSAPLETKHFSPRPIRKRYHRRLR